MLTELGQRLGLNQWYKMSGPWPYFWADEDKNGLFPRQEDEDGMLGSWGRSSISTQRNLTSPQFPIQGSLECFPCKSVKEHDLYQQDYDVALKCKLGQV